MSDGFRLPGVAYRPEAGDFSHIDNDQGADWYIRVVIGDKLIAVYDSRCHPFRDGAHAVLADLFKRWYEERHGKPLGEGPEPTWNDQIPDLVLWIGQDILAVYHSSRWFIADDDPLQGRVIYFNTDEFLEELRPGVGFLGNPDAN